MPIVLFKSMIVFAKASMKQKRQRRMLGLPPRYSPIKSKARTYRCVMAANFSIGIKMTISFLHVSQRYSLMAVEARDSVLKRGKMSMGGTSVSRNGQKYFFNVTEAALPHIQYFHSWYST